MIYEVRDVLKRYKQQREVIDDEIKRLTSDIDSLLKCRSDLDNLINILESEV